MASIFVVGSYVEGLTIRVPRVPALGESLVGESFDMGPGGKGSNQAIGAARLGADVRLLACVGADIFGERAMRLYADEGIRPARIHRIDGAHTGIGFVNVLPNGENWITVDMGANNLMTPQHVEDCAAQIGECDILMTQFEVPPPAVATALALGKATGALTILNPAPARASDARMLANVDVLTPNASEARILLGLAPQDPSPIAELARGLLALGPGTVIITVGADGAYIATADGTTHVPALPIQAVDVTGAGDSFNAALAVGLGAGKTIREAVDSAIYAGAYCALRNGVIAGLPTRAELEQFRASYERA